jgi:hypothetical protein
MSVLWLEKVVRNWHNVTHHKLLMVYHYRRLLVIDMLSVDTNFNSELFKGLLRERERERELTLTFQSLAVSLRTTRFNVKKFYMVLALR